MEEKALKRGTLFVVATPIGNLEDITLRAIRVLKEASLIAAEDTRVAKKLMSRYGISVPLTSYFEHNEIEKAPGLIERMKGGADVALVSDAGTPGISDPGYRLIRLAVANSIPVVPVPGPSALVSVLSVSGLPADEFTFKGFVPSADGKRKGFFLSLKGRSHTFIMFESARRLMQTLDTVVELLGDVDVVIGREVTKLHEEVMRGKVSALREGLKSRDIKGEVTLILRIENEKRRPEDLPADIERLLKSGMGIKEISKALAHEFDMPGAGVYREALKVREGLKS